MSVNAIIQARCGSTRFPNKVFATIDNKPLIYHVVDRLNYASIIDDVIVATTTNSEDDALEQWCSENRVKVFRGSEEYVLNRYYEASLCYPSEITVRITADDPFKEPDVIDKVVNKLIEEKLDLVTNNNPPSFPEGLDCEAFTFKTLQIMENEAHELFEREHVTQFAYHNPDKFRIGNVESDKNLSFLRWTIDTQEDYEMVNKIYESRSSGNTGILLMDEILRILYQHPEISKMNSQVKRSAMYQLT